jgi:hypothetical protein
LFLSCIAHLRCWFASWFHFKEKKKTKIKRQLPCVRI